jgi:hypothetical protein
MVEDKHVENLKISSENDTDNLFFRISYERSVYYYNTFLQLAIVRMSILEGAGTVWKIKKKWTSYWSGAFKLNTFTIFLNC